MLGTNQLFTVYVFLLDSKSSGIEEIFSWTLFEDSHIFVLHEQRGSELLLKNTLGKKAYT